MPIPFFGKQQQDGQQPGQEQQQQQQQQPTETPTHHVPQVDRFETTLKDELKLQELQYPTADDVPGCMRLLYVNFLSSELYFLLTKRDDQRRIPHVLRFVSVSSSPTHLRLTFLLHSSRTPTP